MKKLFQELDELLRNAAEKRRQLEERRDILQRILEQRSGAQRKPQISSPKMVNSLISVVENPAFFPDYTTQVKGPTQRTPSPVISAPVQNCLPLDPYANGLLPALPLCYPRISMYPYLDVQHPFIKQVVPAAVL